MSVSARVLEFEVTVDRGRTAHSDRGGSPIPDDEAWFAEHLVLAGLVRCTLSSLDHSARRAGLEVAATGRAHGVVTKRADDGRYAFVTVESHFDITLDPAPDANGLRDLVARAEKGCFVGNSLAARPSYHWTVNGEDMT